jgi:glycosyltransferase involved in cell wall biosynthesis
VILGIDASNIRAGGGLRHLQKILEFGNPETHNITRVIVWGGANPLERLPHRSWLILNEVPVLNKALHKRLLWQQLELSKLAYKNCDLLFVPGGLYLGSFRPYVTMFQNMQIFETNERNREGLSNVWLRLRFLQSAQSKTFRQASGLICLSEYAHNYLAQNHFDIISKSPVSLISHGTEDFQPSPVSINKIGTNQKPLHLLYVSTIKKYKHQWNLIDAVGLLRKEGLLIKLHLVGSGDAQALRWMKESIQRNDPEQKFIIFHGNLPHEETLEWYHKADMFVFPSTCETFGISLLEAMTASMPIASSDRGPMPEVLKDAGLYFNPESVTSIKNCLRYMIANPDLQKRLGAKAKQYSQNYSWKKCADETFSFLHNIYEKNKNE